MDKKMLQDIRDYLRLIDRPDNPIYKNNELLILSCFGKAMEIIEKNSNLRVVCECNIPNVDKLKIIEYYD